MLKVAEGTVSQNFEQLKADITNIESKVGSCSVL